MRGIHTVTHLQERGPIGDITRVVDISEMSQTPSQSYRCVHLPCYEFFQRMENVRVYHKLDRLFSLHLQGGQSILVGVAFTLTPKAISVAIGIPNIGEQWQKKKKGGKALL